MLFSLDSWTNIRHAEEFKANQEPLMTTYRFDPETIKVRIKPTVGKITRVKGWTAFFKATKFLETEGENSGRREQKRICQVTPEPTRRMAFESLQDFYTSIVDLRQAVLDEEEESK
jgi:hypothetical protein